MNNSAIKVYNTLTQEKQPLVTIVPGQVKMYVCGMTVYDYCHIGHARVLVAFDLISRYLRYRGFEVKYVRNITDVDDKIFARSAENNEDFTVLTDRFIQAMHEDEKALGVLPPDQEPRATDHIQQIIDMIAVLVEKKVAYLANNGDVYFSIDKFNGYGQLSKKRIEDLLAGARVDIAESKQNPLDFALWKSAKPGEASWSSPWGDGRPGWHIECSAMATYCLGNTFDIHGGGPDLKFPHHENEIAQSEAASGEKFVNYWLHAGAVRVNKEKMSKSLGNFFTIRDVLKKYSAEVVRFLLVSCHYRSQIDYSDQNLVEAHASLNRLYQSLRGIDFDAGQSPIPEYRQRFVAAMDDDFNTPGALAVLFEIAKEINRHKERDAEKAALLAGTLVSLSGVLGILQSDPEVYFKLDNASKKEDAISADQIEQLIQQRNAARKDKNWAESDRIRDQLKEQGVVLDDGREGTTWRRLQF